MGFLGATAHYFDGFTLKSVSLGLKRIIGSNTVGNLHDALRSLFNQFGIFDKIIFPNYAFIKPLVINKLDALRKETSNKLQLHTYITIKYKVRQYDEEDKYIEKERFFNSSSILITSNNQINQFYNMFVDEFNKKLEEDNEGSSWNFYGITKLKIKINVQKSILGRAHVELSSIIKNKRACVNPKNDDDKCFTWCLLMAKHYIDIKSHHRSEFKCYKKYWGEIIEPEKRRFVTKINATIYINHNNELFDK